MNDILSSLEHAFASHDPEQVAALFAEGRLYMEPVDRAESTIDDAVEDLYSS
jgi:hypothetical protein